MTNGCCTTTATIPATTAATAGATVLPALDVMETSEEFRILVDVPGRAPEDVDVRVENRVLTIQARVPAREETTGKYHVREHGARELVRRLRLSDAIDANAIRAEVARGLLTVRLPKLAAAKARRIEVR
jgi:HSP20 family protein